MNQEFSVGDSVAYIADKNGKYALIETVNGLPLEFKTPLKYGFITLIHYGLDGCPYYVYTTIFKQPIVIENKNLKGARAILMEKTNQNIYNSNIYADYDSCYDGEYDININEDEE